MKMDLQVRAKMETEGTDQGIIRRRRVGAIVNVARKRVKGQLWVSGGSLH